MQPGCGVSQLTATLLTPASDHALYIMIPSRVFRCGRCSGHDLARCPFLLLISHVHAYVFIYMHADVLTKPLMQTLIVPHSFSLNIKRSCIH